MTSNATKKKSFDHSLSKGSNSGYVIKEDGRMYDDYMTNDDFIAFIHTLETSLPEVFNSYNKGKGSEWKEKRGKKNKLTPPKMASFASSSKFALSSFTSIDEHGFHLVEQIGNIPIHNIEFEKDLPIFDRNGCELGGISPQMDVFFLTSCPNFVEVKCHEIFDDHPLEFSLSYDKVPLFEEIVGDKKEKIIKIVDGKEQEKYRVTREDLGIDVGSQHFDVAQLIRHLMGIVSYSSDAKKNFYYLFFRSNDPQFSKIYEELENEFQAIQSRFADIFMKYNISFSLLYNDKFDTLTSLN